MKIKEKKNRLEKQKDMLQCLSMFQDLHPFFIFTLFAINDVDLRKIQVNKSII